MIVISLKCLVMNLSYLCRQVLAGFLCQFLDIKYMFRQIKKYITPRNRQEKLALLNKGMTKMRKVFEETYPLEIGKEWEHL